MTPAYRSNHREPAMTKHPAPAYEIHNPSFGDMTLAQQIDAGINDWCAEGRSGHPYYGRTKVEAEAIRATYEG